MEGKIEEDQTSEDQRDSTDPTANRDSTNLNLGTNQITREVGINHQEEEDSDHPANQAFTEAEVSSKEVNRSKEEYLHLKRRWMRSK